MSDDKLDKKLAEIYSEPVCPPEVLVQRTKASVKKPGLLEYTIAVSIALNLLTALVFAYVMTIGLRSIFARVVLFITASIICNALILVIFMYREKVREFFITLETYKI